MHTRYESLLVGYPDEQRTQRRTLGCVESSAERAIVGDEVPPWTRGFIGVDVETLIAHDSLTLLRGSTTEMADELQRHRDLHGVSYLSVNGAFLERLAPVVGRLSGR